MAALHAQNERLRSENKRLRTLLEEKGAQIAELEERVARLERLISRNSGNSSMPPSTDDLPGKKPPERKPRCGCARKPGKQPGSPGAYLAWSDRPDKRVDTFPEGACSCGKGLARAADLGVRYSHQVTGLPDARAVTTQYDRHEVERACGRVHVADAPPEAAGAPGTVTYGLNFQAWCVFLMVMHHVPVERCLDIIESMSGIRPQRRVGAHAAGACRPGGRGGEQGDPGADHPCPGRLRRRDPAPGGAGPKSRKKYLQVACTSLLTYYFLGDRDLASFKGFVYSGLHGAVVVHDRYQDYGSFPGISHQLCCQHLLRDLEDAAESYPEAVWPGQTADALRGLIHAANAAGDRGMSTVPAETTAEHLKLFRHGVRVGLSQVRRVPGTKSK